jgi:hypothetical protein
VKRPSIRSSWASGAFLGGLLVVSAGPVLAGPGGPLLDREGEEKKAEKELDDAEKKQGKAGGQGAQPGPGGAGGLGEMENPLKKILELMEQVEGRLYDSDTGSFTQQEQKKIVEAMRFEDKTHQALEELIKKIEEQMKQQQQQQSQGGGGQQQKQQQKQQDQQQNETPEQKKEREERERREKEQEEQRKAQQQNSPQNQQQQQNPQNDQERRARQEQQRNQETPDPTRDEAGRERTAAGRWGMLPSKLFQDAANAQNVEPPGKWAELINRYRQRLARTGDQNQQR